MINDKKTSPANPKRGGAPKREAHKKRKARVNPVFVAKTETDAATMAAVIRTTSESVKEKETDYTISQPVVVFGQCPQCQKMMTPSSLLITATIPPQRRYDCLSCGARAYFVEPSKETKE